MAGAEGGVSGAVDIDGMMAWVKGQGYPEVTLEHAIDPRLLFHESWLTVPGYTTRPRIVLFHPANCGCAATPVELVLHG